MNRDNKDMKKTLKIDVKRNRIFTSRHAYIVPKLYEAMTRMAYAEAMNGDMDCAQWILDELIIRDREAVKNEYNSLRVNNKTIKDMQKQPCAICGGKGGQIDHITPISRGGTNDLDNLQPVCKSCNSKKSDKIQ